MATINTPPELDDNADIRTISTILNQLIGIINNLAGTGLTWNGTKTALNLSANYNPETTGTTTDMKSVYVGADGKLWTTIDGSAESRYVYDTEQLMNATNHVPTSHCIYSILGTTESKLDSTLSTLGEW